MAQEQDWDYQKYPWMPVEYKHLDAEIRMDNTGLIEGDILYTLLIKDAFADSLIFDAPGAEIISTEVQNSSVNSYMDEDVLVVYLEENYSRGQEISLRIRYRNNPEFGLHHTETGTIFTSNLPKTTSHWLPVADHPRVEFTAEIIVTHPASKMLVMNGRRGETSVVSVDEEITAYSVNRPVSPTGMNWVMGDLEGVASTVSSGWTQGVSPDLSLLFQRRTDPQIYIYSETPYNNGSELLTEVAKVFKLMQTETGVSYPFRDLQIVLLKDDYWETKPYGDGILYLFQNRGDLTFQIQEGVISQWIGAKVREPQWSDANAVLLLKSYYLNLMNDQNISLDQSAEPYDVFDGAELLKWANFWNSEADSVLNSIIDSAVSETFRSLYNVLNYNTLANIIYNISGKPYFEGFNPSPPVAESDTLYDYRVSIERQEDTDAFQLYFEALGEPVEELVNVTVKEQSVSDSRTHELTFTGSSDTIILTVSSGIENLSVHISDRDDIKLSESKPFEFWIFQLQNGEDTESQLEAARALSFFEDNPDLQLALTDLLNLESNPEIQAEILKSVSSITAGAAGTEMLFLERIDSGYSDPVRVAAIESLAYFSGNDQVISRLRSVMNQADKREITQAAIRSLFEVTEQDQFKNIVENQITKETNLAIVPHMLQLLARKGEEESAVRFGSTFLAEGFPYSVREKVFEFILEYDESQSGWESRLPVLLSDRDPRIRYKAAAALGRMSSQSRNQLIDRRLTEEYDERVIRALKSEYE